MPAVRKHVFPSMRVQLREWAELHAHYSPDASCSSRLRFWLSLACVFICVAWRGMRSWKHAYSSSAETAGSILRTHLQVCGVPQVRPPPLLVELVESHIREGVTGNVRPAALHQPRDLRRPDCLVDMILLVRGHTCWQHGRREWLADHGLPDIDEPLGGLRDFRRLLPKGGKGHESEDEHQRA